MTALTVFIIRHGEKPETKGDGPGLTEAGAADESSLTLRGWQRAGAWATLFGSGLGGADYPKPTALFAASPERAAEGKPRRRQVQTIAPLASRLGLVPDTRFGKGEEQALARGVLACTGVVLVSWEHKLITAALLPALLDDGAVPDVPREWDPARFDVVLRLDRVTADAPWQFRQLFPRLLAGDSDTPLR